MSNTMTFQYGVLAANNTDLPAVDGTVNAYAAQALSADRSMQNRTLSVVSPGDTVFYSARCGLVVLILFVLPCLLFHW